MVDTVAATTKSLKDALVEKRKPGRPKKNDTVKKHVFPKAKNSPITDALKVTAAAKKKATTGKVFTAPTSVQDLSARIHDLEYENTVLLAHIGRMTLAANSYFSCTTNG